MVEGPYKDRNLPATVLAGTAADHIDWRATQRPGELNLVCTYTGTCAAYDLELLVVGDFEDPEAVAIKLDGADGAVVFASQRLARPCVVIGGLLESYRQLVAAIKQVAGRHNHDNEGWQANAFKDRLGELLSEGLQRVANPDGAAGPARRD